MGKELVKVKVRVPTWVGDCETVASGEKLERLRERVSRRRRRHTRKRVKKDLTKAAGISLGLSLVLCRRKNACRQAEGCEVGLDILDETSG